MPSGKIVLLILTIFCSLTTQAQSVKSFSENPAQFTADVELMFSTISSPSTGIKVRELLEPFLEYWDANLYNSEEKAAIINNANTLLVRKLPIYPNLYYFFSIAYNLKKKGNEDAVLIWSNDFLKRVPGLNQRKIESYLMQYELLASENILFQSSTFTWYISDTSLQMEYDTAIRIIYRDVSLTCATRKDTSVILNTGGMFFPNNYDWIGRNGRVTWERVELDPDSVFADLTDYRINMKFSEYYADTVRFINRKYFKEPLFGKLIEKVLASPRSPKSTYPQFVSYLKNYEIHNLFKDIDYRGGFSVEGARVIGSGEINQNASLFFSKDGKVRIQVRSNGFRIQGDQIMAYPASISILVDGDSVFHPGMQMNYFDDKRQLIMYRPESGISQSPFFNGFHEIDMNCGAMYWDLDSNFVTFESEPGINRISKNEFISNNFFSEYEFYKLQGIDDKNPLFFIRDFSRTYGTKEVTPDALAQFMNKSPEQVKAMLIRLSIQGYLYYDLINNKAIIQDRLYQVIEAKAGRRDYDVITINSETNSISNARLDLGNYDLLLRGVKEVFLSDSQQVYIYPEKDEIVIKKGLDITFSGNVKAGLFDFYAHDCSFEYDSFKLNIPLIDSMSFQVKSFKKNDRGERPLVRVASVIENLSGKLQIDYPTNKSGKASLSEYPIFYSEKESFVYYDHDPLYERDSFAYHIYSFVIDSLDNFSTENLIFDGYLVSDGIFPDIMQPMKVQQDYSLGFINYTPEQGYPAYANSGKFFNEVNLSNRGLRGNGQLEYLTSLTVSDDFLFYPDSVITELAGHFTIEPQIARVEYPKVSADSIYQVWYPYSDTMHLQTIRLPLKMYDEKAELSGDLYYSSNGLSGKGKVGFESVELASERYVFKHHTIDADTLDFRLFAAGTGDLAVSAEKYRTHVDFDTRMVEFKTNEKGSTVSFPYNHFLCYMDNVDWYMDQHEMKLYNDLGAQFANLDNMSREELLKLDLSGSDFVATNPLADSLSFFSVTARYDLNEYIIDAQGVKLIRIADAAVFPDSGFVKISRGGLIQPLKNAGIIADTASRFHTIEKSDLTLISRKNFNGKGTYQYHDSTGILQEFPLTLISVDSTGRTFAQGNIVEKLNFTLNPYFDFRGKVNLTSARKELSFEGGFRTHDDCFGTASRNWVYFNSWIDPDNVRIPVQPPLVDITGNPIEMAIQISNNEEEIYASWFKPKAGAGDTALVKPSGKLYYDESAMAYKITQDEKESSGKNKSSFVYFTRNCSMEFSGPMGLGLAFNYLTLKSFGDIRYLIIPDSTTMNLTLTFDFLFYEGCMMMMADSLLKSDLRGLDITRRDYMAFLDYSLGKEGSKDIKDDILNYGKIRRLPEELIHQIVLTDVNLYWNSITNSYISRGPIGILSLGKDPVNRYANGYLELIRRRGGDVISLYLEVNPMQYYFFDYRNGIMQSISSDMAFNNRIDEIKQEKRVINTPGLEESYEYLVSTKRRVIDFLRRMEPFKN